MTEEVEEQVELPIIRNKQPVEKAIVHPRGGVDIVSVFLTIQGEGPFSGHPAIFIRTAGCNLSKVCLGCDTNYTKNRHILNPSQIVNIVQSLRQPCLVVITGGEPFRQDISPLVRLLINTGYRVQVETNGTYSQDRFPWAKTIVICSPKTAKLHPGLQINYFKYVLDAEHIDPKDGLPTSVLGSNIRPARPNDMDAVPIYISPADEYNEEKNEKNLRACIQSVFNFGYILSCQSHKEWQLP